MSNPAAVARALAADLCKVFKKHKASITWKLDGDKAIITAVVQDEQAPMIVDEGKKQN